MRQAHQVASKKTSLEAVLAPPPPPPPPPTVPQGGGGSGRSSGLGLAIRARKRAAGGDPPPPDIPREVFKRNPTRAAASKPINYKEDDLDLDGEPVHRVLKAHRANRYGEDGDEDFQAQEAEDEEDEEDTADQGEGAGSGFVRAAPAARMVGVGRSVYRGGVHQSHGASAGPGAGVGVGAGAGVGVGAGAGGAGTSGGSARPYEWKPRGPRVMANASQLGITALPSGPSRPASTAAVPMQTPYSSRGTTPYGKSGTGPTDKAMIKPGMVRGSATMTLAMGGGGGGLQRREGGCCTS